jgi:hypothetical protein
MENDIDHTLNDGMSHGNGGAGKIFFLEWVRRRDFGGQAVELGRGSL